MEERGSSRAIQVTESVADRNYSKMILAPKDFFLGPVFAATKQSGPREVTVRVPIGNEIVERRYQIGGFHPLKRNCHPPALDVRHARAIFCLLSFRDRNDPSGTRLIRFSLNEFCRKYAHTNGGRYSRDIKDILGDLTDSFIRVTDVKTRMAETYRLLERVDILDKPIRRRNAAAVRDTQTEMWFNGCTLSPEFFDLLSRIAELQYLKLPVFTSIRSPLAQAIYLYIPSRAYHRTEHRPFEISLGKLLEQVSFPASSYKSKRKELFTKHAEEGRSILQQLDGLETLTGQFRVRLAEMVDGSDWKLQAWLEESAQKPKSFVRDSKLITAYLKSGGTPAEVEQARRRIEPLTDYECDLLGVAEVEIEKNRKFFELAKGFLKPSRFTELLHEAKCDLLEGKQAKKTPTARLIYRIMQAIAEPKRSLNHRLCLDNRGNGKPFRGLDNGRKNS